MYVYMICVRDNLNSTRAIRQTGLFYYSLAIRCTNIILRLLLLHGRLQHRVRKKMEPKHNYPREAMLARVFARATCPSVHLSVCPSVCHTPVLYQNDCIVFLHHLVPRDSSFLTPYFITKFERGRPERGRQTRVRISSSFERQYLENGAR